MGCTGIESLIVSNYDQDHVSDLQNVLRQFRVKVLYRNKTIPLQDLERIKLQNGPISVAMRSLLDMASEYRYDVTDYPDFSGVKFELFHNDYPEFTDTNNLSMVTYVSYGGMGILFPGDLERAGWDALLRNTRFRQVLGDVNIFVASHHGRENGYNERVFEYCSPDIVIISDKGIVHETQNNRYINHASGIPWNGGTERRYVLTTRNDGHIRIEKEIGSGYHISI